MRRPLTRYRQRDSLDFMRGPREIARFEFPRYSKTATIQGSRIITVPPGSTWNTGLHWHEAYAESVKILRGQARITLNGVTKTYNPDDGIITFPKFTIHGFGRADGGNSTQDAEDTVLEEWVDPGTITVLSITVVPTGERLITVEEDGFKLVFFYNILGALQECQGKPGLGDLLQLGTTLAYIDEYPVFIPGPFLFKRGVTHFTLATVYLIGRLCGYNAWQQEYTPEYLWEVAKTAGEKTRPQIPWIR